MTQHVPQELSAAGLELLRRRLAGPAGPASGPSPRDGRPPLSLAQRRLWFVDRLAQGNLAYNVPASYRLRGPLDVSSLSRALACVVRRHAILRTCFRVGDDGEPYQVVADQPDGTEPRLYDLSADPDPVGRARQLAREAADTRFDLERGPLLRTWLARLGDDDHVFGIVVHHLLFDRDSLQIWAAEVSAAYAAAVRGDDAELPELSVQYADFAHWQRESIGGPRFDRQVAYWRKRLRGVPVVLELPTDHERPAKPTYRAGEAAVRLGATAVQRLRDLAARSQASLFMVCLAAFQALLARYTASTEVIVGCPVNGRTQVRFEPLIGFFANSLPIYADLRGDPTFDRVLASTREALFAAYENQDVPFDRIVQEVAPPRDLSRNPLIQVWFDLASGLDGGPSGELLNLPGVSTEYFAEGRVRTRFDLELHLGEAPDGGLGGRLLYALDLFEPATAELFVEHYVAFLAAVAEQPGRRLSQVPIFTASQLNTILTDWGAADELSVPPAGRAAGGTT